MIYIKDKCELLLYTIVQMILEFQKTWQGSQILILMKELMNQKEYQNNFSKINSKQWKSKMKLPIFRKWQLKLKQICKEPKPRFCRNTKNQQQKKQKTTQTKRPQAKRNMNQQIVSIQILNYSLYQMIQQLVWILRCKKARQSKNCFSKEGIAIQPVSLLFRMIKNQSQNQDNRLILCFSQIQFAWRGFKNQEDLPRNKQKNCQMQCGFIKTNMLRYYLIDVIRNFIMQRQFKDSSFSSVPMPLSNFVNWLEITLKNKLDILINQYVLKYDPWSTNFVWYLQIFVTLLYIQMKEPSDINQSHNIPQVRNGELILDLIQFEYLNKFLDQSDKIDISKLHKRLNLSHQTSEKRRLDWESFIQKSQKLVNDNLNEQLSPIETLFKLKKACPHYQYEPICQEFKKWKQDKESLASIIDSLEHVQEIPHSGLSNYEINKILDLYEIHIKGFKSFGILTSDFMVCNVQRRFQGESLGITHKQILENKQKIHQLGTTDVVNKTNGHILGSLDEEKVQYLLDQGIDIIGAVINTETCDSGGMHWVALTIDLKKKQILLFNSVGEYQQQLQAVRIYCFDLQKILTKMFKTPFNVEFLEDEVQSKENTCGVFCLMFITCQIFEIDYKKLYQMLHQDKQERFVDIFKHMFFG